MNRKKVLLVAENHNLASGFGTYCKNLLESLHNSGKYEVAEFAIYAKQSVGKNLPWKFFGNEPEDNDPQLEKDLYNSNANHQFGAWRFDKVCLEFKPDIVLSIRDPWMDMFISKSPLLPYFHWVWMPTVDSMPQKQSWLEGFAKADALLCYSEFGVKTLTKDGGHTLNVIGCASPGIDPDTYKPMDRNSVRKELGISTDINIVGTVMRNQKRKLFPELFKSFTYYLDHAPSEIANKTYLLLHTSYPEKLGWNLGYHISEFELGGRVLATYICKECRRYKIDFFRDSLNFCEHCNKISCVMPSVSIALDVKDLAKIYNVMDLYVQYAICEGFGMPQVEAAACGIPVAATNYSAMEDVVKNTNGYPIKVDKFFRELETNAERAYPSNEHFAEIMIKHFSLSTEEREQLSKIVREKTISRYNWHDTASVWMNYIDSYKPIGLQGMWNHNPKIFPIPNEYPKNINNERFVDFIFHEVLQEPENAYGYEATKLLRDLNLGVYIEHGIIEPINRDTIFEKMKTRAENKVLVEKIRSGMATLQPDNFILEARKYGN